MLVGCRRQDVLLGLDVGKRGKARRALKTGFTASSADALAAAQTRMAEAESATLRMVYEGPRRWMWWWEREKE